MGDVIGDLNSRRGAITGIEDVPGLKIIGATVPLANMFGYVSDLRSKTQGRAVPSMTFKEYQPVPRNISDEIIAKAKGE
jgi:elongation factor G